MFTFRISDYFINARYLSLGASTSVLLVWLAIS
jgi:hypothetical protein